MGSIQRNVVSAVIGAAAAMLVLRVGREDRPLPSSGHPVAADGAAELELEVQSLAARVASLEARAGRVSASVGDAEPVVRVEAPTANATMADVARLQTELAALQRRVALLDWLPVRADSGSAEEQRAISSTLGRLESDRPGDVAALLARIPLQRRYLEQWPDGRHALDHLRHLVDAYVLLDQRRAASDAIERFGPRLGVETWQLDGLRERAAEDGDRIGLARRIVTSQAPESERIEAMYRIVLTLERMDRRDEALQTFEQLLRRFVGTDGGKYFADRAQAIRARIAGGG